ncbi:acetoacetate--CoA ligase [Aeromicrobium sp. IC_218]|uniref:acetoacetate--CoA ligase n=1 Tax=Aeromicrobium sp. IC_218 TaxID=2545468 RepID=UPI00103EF7F3|nr:acetoacetate--CoA ligase [Aeromicrobium sp. IC_218]TCI96829.1 acetoacetate--CoA ligase [Aeromicrobium sp. IC_218]
MSEVLWRPSGRRTRLDDFRDELACLGHRFDDYESLWRWSVDDLDAFWLAVWRFVDIPSDAGPTVALADDAMPGARWFPEVRLSYAEAMLRLPGRADDDVVVVGRSQSRDDVRLTAAELRDQVARARAGLVRAGVGRGDRVAAYAPNVPETLVLLLAAASLGAVFTSCAPEFGTQSVVDRWRQVEPVVLLAVDGYRYGEKPIDRRAEVEQVRAALPSVRTLVHLPYLDPDAPAPEGATTWDELLGEPADLAFDRAPFDHPLYVLFSSGTTGLPKPIVHGHGGITLEHLKCFALQNDVGSGDRFFWFSTTGWMMWNYLVSALGVGATIVMLDGDPAYPDLGALWRIVEQERLTYFGTSAPYLLQCRKAGLVPREEADLSSLRAIGSTGAPLPAEGFRWVYDAVVPPGQDVQLVSISGGTDVCSAFVGGAPDVPVVAGEISCRALGAAVQAYDLAGEPVVGELGELVVTRPMPSMPVGFWGDEDGSRYRAAYFEDFPGVWRHGDWITLTEDGTCVVSGRSDATLNRGGVRLGTAEFYGVVESLPEVADSLVVHLEDAEGGAGRLILFVVMAEGATFDDDVRRDIATALRSRLSPRHVPDDVAAVRALPRTLSGKKLEVPVKKILRGTPVEDAAARGALVDPTALDEIVRYREAHPQP